jgi:hypothetical protein
MIKMKVKQPDALSIRYTVVSVLRISAERLLSQVLARPSEWPELSSRLNEPAFFCLPFPHPVDHRCKSSTVITILRKTMRHWNRFQVILPAQRWNQPFFGQLEPEREPRITSQRPALHLSKAAARAAAFVL